MQSLALCIYFVNTYIVFDLPAHHRPARLGGGAEPEGCHRGVYAGRWVLGGAICYINNSCLGNEYAG